MGRRKFLWTLKHPFRSLTWKNQDHQHFLPKPLFYVGMAWGRLAGGFTHTLLPGDVPLCTLSENKLCSFLHNVPRWGIGEYRKGLEVPKYTSISLMIKLASFIILSRMSSILSELNIIKVLYFSGFPDSSVGKESACNVGDLGLTPGLGRSSGEGKGYPLQYSGLENSMDCIVHGVTKSRNDWATFTL